MDKLINVPNEFSTCLATGIFPCNASGSVPAASFSRWDLVFSGHCFNLFSSIQRGRPNIHMAKLPYLMPRPKFFVIRTPAESSPHGGQPKSFSSERHGAKILLAFSTRLGVLEAPNLELVLFYSVLEEGIVDFLRYR